MAATMRTAWAESPSLALHLVTRFQSTAMASALRWLLLNFPEKALEEPDALQFLLGSSLPNDVSYQLKVSRKQACRRYSHLIIVVPPVLGTGKSSNCSYILPAGIR